MYAVTTKDVATSSSQCLSVILSRRQLIQKKTEAYLVVSVLKTRVTVCVHQRGPNIGRSNRARTSLNSALIVVVVVLFLLVIDKNHKVNVSFQSVSNQTEVPTCLVTMWKMFNFDVQFVLSEIMFDSLIVATNSQTNRLEPHQLVKRHYQ